MEHFFLKKKNIALKRILLNQLWNVLLLSGNLLTKWKLTSSSRVLFKIKLQAYKFVKEGTPTQVFPCEFCEILKNIFLASDCFSKYVSFFMIAAVHSCLSKRLLKFVENIHICIRCNVHLVTSFVKLKIGWINTMIIKR